MIKVNLLSPERKEMAPGMGGEAPSFEEERESKLNTGAAIAAAIVTFGVIAYLLISQSSAISQKREYLKERFARKAQLDNVLKTITDLEKTRKSLDNKVKLISELKSRQKDAVKMMDELSNALPDWVWLTNLSFTGRMLTIKGKTLGNNLISDLINNLKGTGSFYDIQFPGSQRKREGGLDIFNFSLSCSYKDKDSATAKTKKAK